MKLKELFKISKKIDYLYVNMYDYDFDEENNKSSVEMIKSLIAQEDDLLENISIQELEIIVDNIEKYGIDNLSLYQQRTFDKLYNYYFEKYGDDIDKEYKLYTDILTNNAIIKMNNIINNDSLNLKSIDENFLQEVKDKFMMFLISFCYCNSNIENKLIKVGFDLNNLKEETENNIDYAEYQKNCINLIIMENARSKVIFNAENIVEILYEKFLYQMNSDNLNDEDKLALKKYLQKYLDYKDNDVLNIFNNSFHK